MLKIALKTDLIAHWFHSKNPSNRRRIMKSQPFAAVPAFVLVTLVLNLVLGVVPCKAAGGIDPHVDYMNIAAQNKEQNSRKLQRHEERIPLPPPLPPFPGPPKIDKISQVDFDFSCTDSPLKVLTGKNIKSAKTCAAVGKKRKKFCKKNTVKSHCPSACRACDTFGTADSTGKFIFENKQRDCASWLRGFVASLDLDEVSRLCEIDSIRETCRHTCSYFWCTSEKPCGEKITTIIESEFGEVISGSPQEAALEWLIGDITGEGCDNLDEAMIIQRFALAVFYYSTGGDEWYNNDRWLSSADECSWYGIDCYHDDKVLAYFNLSDNNLSGTIPDEIKVLDSLEYLYLGDNSLTAAFPDVSGLSSLRWINLDYNKFTGMISDKFDGLTDLYGISLSGNALTGSVPDLSGLASLQYFYARGNQFTGQLINALDSLANLIAIDFSDNAFTGTIPDLAGFRNLQYFYACCNELTGTIPVMTEMMNLSQITLGNNALTGTIPDLSWGTDLWYFAAWDNQLTGPLIDQLDGLTNLRWFFMSWNALTGTIPDISGLISLQDFTVSGNEFTGSVTDQFNGMANLTTLNLGHNALTGAVPDFLTNPNLGYLYLEFNEFNGELAAELFEMPSLEHLYLNGNELTGPIPDNFGGSTSLRRIYLNDNLLTGTIPGITGDSLESIESLSLYLNKMSDPVPDSICDLRSSNPDQFQYLEADCNPPDNAQNPCPSDCCTYCTIGKGVDP